MDATYGPARDGYNAFIERHDVAWELAMGALALVWVALGFVVDQVGEGVRPDLEAAEFALTGVFVAEFATRFLAAHDRVQYVRGHVIDALALVPPLRALRVLRLIRLLRLVRAFAGFYRVAMHVQGLSRYRGFAWLLAAWLTLMTICSVFVYLAEHGANPDLASPLDALWWGVSTVTTVGYGKLQTPEARVAAMVLMLLGIGLFSAVTASITSYFLSQGGAAGRAHPSVPEQLRTLADLRENGSLTEDEYTEAKVTVLRGTMG